MNCITLTLNPAFDHHCFVQNFSLYHEHLVKDSRYEAGGKGVNISRALCANNVPNTALVVMGEENSAQFCAALDADKITYKSIIVPGRVIENLTIHTNDSPETRVSFSGFASDASLLDKVMAEIEEKIDTETIVTFTGRVPNGINMPQILTFLARISKKGARIVIDSKSFATLEEIVSAKPWLIKPNQEEISEYLGREIKSLEETIFAARDIHRQGVENVMISLGGDGALLVCSEGAYICTPPRVEVKSTIGAGDSSIGGYIAAAMEGKSPKECLLRAVAYGSAACTREGTLPPLPCDVADVLSNSVIKNID